MWLLVSLATAFVPMCASAPPAREVRAAGHHGTWTGASIDWESEVLFDHGAHSFTLELAHPLDPDVQGLTATPGDVEPILDADGRIVALQLDNLAGSDRVWLELSQPIRGELEAPLMDSPALQRVTFDGMYFEPEPEAGLQRHLRYLAQPEITLRERRLLDQRLGDRATVSDHPMYLKADGRLQSGLAGEVRAVGERRTGVTLAAGSIFLGLMGGLVLAYKMLERLSRREEDRSEKERIRQEREALREELAGMR